MAINKKIKNFCITNCDDLENDYSGTDKNTKIFPFAVGITIPFLLVVLSLIFLKKMLPSELLQE